MVMSNLKSLLFTVGLGAAMTGLMPTTGYSSEITWDGSASTDFSAGDNWVNGVAPANDSTDTGDVAVLPGAVTTNQPSLTDDYGLNGLRFDSAGWTLGGTGFTLSVAGTGKPGGLGIVTTNASGTNTINSDVAISSKDTTATGFDVATGGTLVINGDLSRISLGGGGAIAKAGGGTLELHGGGTFTIFEIEGGTVRAMAGTGGVSSTAGNKSLEIDSGGTYDVYGINLKIQNISLAAGGTLTNSSNDLRAVTILTSRPSNTLSGTISGDLKMSYGTNGQSRTFTIDSNTNTYSGQTIVSGNVTLLADNAAGSATGTGDVILSQNGGAVLGGNGFISGTVKAKDSSTIAPGDEDSIGTLTVGSTTFIGGSTFEVGLAGATSDLLVVNGDLTLNSGALLSVLGTADNLTNYVIATYTGTLTGTFGTPVLPSNYTIDYGDGSNSQITLAMIPEPTTGALLLLGVGGLLMLPRRRKVSSC